MKRLLITIIFFLLIVTQVRPAFILLPMDDTQKDHLKAYGITFWTLQNQVEAWWLLNYRGGSFLLLFSPEIEKECVLRGVSYEIIADAQKNSIFNEISAPSVNMDAVKLEKAPKIAVYTPPFTQPWTMQ
jgi:hypothetical protein